MPKKAGSYDYDTYWTDDWSGYESYYGYDGDYSRGDWYNWSYFAFVEELTASEDKHSESFDFVSEDGQTGPDQPVLFFGHLLVPISRTRTCGSLRIRASVRVFVVPVLSDLNRFSIESIRHV